MLYLLVEPAQRTSGFVTCGTDQPIQGDASEETPSSLNRHLLELLVNLSLLVYLN